MVTLLARRTPTERRLMTIAREQKSTWWHNFPNVLAVSDVDILSFPKPQVIIVLAASWQYMLYVVFMIKMLD